jgi:hypothetical protein
LPKAFRPRQGDQEILSFHLYVEVIGDWTLLFSRAAVVPLSRIKKLKEHGF